MRNRAPGWWRHGLPAACGVVLGGGASAVINLATSGGTMPLAIGAVAAVMTWGTWEGWRAIRSWSKNPGTEPSGRAVHGEVDVKDLYGRAYGVDTSADTGSTSVEGRVRADTVHRGAEAVGVHLRGTRRSQMNG